MDIAKTEKDNLNRRQAFRVYEKVDLFFHKIEFNEEQFDNANFDTVLNNAIQSFKSGFPIQYTSSSIEKLLPSSYSQKNETLHINISSTGISFTSKEELAPYDYIMIRLLLLSTKTEVITCCKVVYVRPSNPFEKDQYPFTIGARFVKLKPKNKDQLDKHIRKKRSLQLVVTAFIFCLFLITIQVPDLVVELTVGLFSFLMDEIIELLHLTYEMLEYSLDLIIEHVFHTGIQSTQTIVFYIQLVIAIAISFPLSRMVLAVARKSIYLCQLSFYRKKSSLLYFWGRATLWYKIGVSSIALIPLVFFGLFLI